MAMDRSTEVEEVGSLFFHLELRANHFDKKACYWVRRKTAAIIIKLLFVAGVHTRVVTLDFD